jgi:non-homologous end joining protein Ku
MGGSLHRTDATQKPSRMNYLTRSQLAFTRSFPMPQRAQWNGFLRLSLVSCPIALYSAVATEKRISFRRVSRTTGNRLRTQLVDTGTGEVVPSDQRGRGYEVAQDRFLLVDDDELQAALEEARVRPFSGPPAKAVEEALTAEPERARMPAPSPAPSTPARRADFDSRSMFGASTTPPAPTGAKRPATNVAPDLQGEPPPVAAAPMPTPRPINDRTIALDRFVSERDIDWRYLDTPYYIVPRDEIGQEAFAVIRDAMREREVVGMGRVVLQKRERPLIVSPMGDGMCGFTLRYAHEIRGADEYFDAIPKVVLPEDMVEMAGLLIDKKAGVFDPAFLEDRYRSVLVEKLRQKKAALPLHAEPAGPARQAQNVIDLMSALQRSVAGEKARRGGKARPPSPDLLKRTPGRPVAAAKPSATKRSRPHSR